jgi:outer membrane protein OmpA-like peptidoglycan-associated protein
MNFRRLLLCAVGLSSLAMVRVAGAQSREAEFSLNRFEPSERGSDWFAAESLDFRGTPRFALGAMVDYARNPLVLYDTNGEKLRPLISDQLFLHAGGSLVLSNRVRLALNMPVGLVLRGDGGALDTTVVVADEGPALGDLRAAVDVRLAGQYRDPLTVAAGVRAWLPTGSEAAYAGDGSIRIGPRVMLAGEVDAFAYAAQLGYTYRANDDAFAGAARGQELNFSVAAGVRALGGDLLLGPELLGSTVVSESDALFGRRTTALELIFAGHGMLSRSLRMGIGAGPGLTRGVGTPEIRGLLSLEWMSELKQPKPTDRDGDGVFGDKDACPGMYGEPSDDPATNGCWPPMGPREVSAAAKDACAEQRGLLPDDPELQKCPDADGDRITDASDACPSEPGPPSEEPKTNGCPAGDGDGDGVLDSEDACPNSAGPNNADPKKRGCPVARVESGQIRIREQVQFAYNSARILAESDAVLSAVQKILKDNPKIRRLRVQGHTDNRGAARFNKRLSQRRAEAAADWLARHGVPRARLAAEGFGEERPLETNDTAEGRAVNRRVEFHIEDAPGADGD